ncbi:MAG: STAS domain-containing protein [Acidobacteriota bacterium]|nr:STAS domain-containing protein [Acidobacteriota bacterium]
MNHIQGCAPVLEHGFYSEGITLGEKTFTTGGATGSGENVTVICCQGRIVYGPDSSLLSEKVSRLFPHPRQIVLDLSLVEMIDGTGLGELVAIWMHAKANNRIVKLAAPRRRIRKMLELTHLNSVFQVYPTLGDALDSFTLEPFKDRAVAR